MPKMLLAAGPTMFVRVTAILICVLDTPLTPLAAGQPGASPGPPVGPLAPGTAPAFDTAAPGPPIPVPPPAEPPFAPAPAPFASAAPFAPGPVPVSPPIPPPAAARLVDLGPDPGTSSHTSSTMTSVPATPALIRSAVGARRAQKRNS